MNDEIVKIPYIGMLGTWESVVVPILIMAVSVAVSATVVIAGVSNEGLAVTEKRSNQLLALTAICFMIACAPAVYWAMYFVQNFQSSEVYA